MCGWWNCSIFAQQTLQLPCLLADWNGLSLNSISAWPCTVYNLAARHKQRLLLGDQWNELICINLHPAKKLKNKNVFVNEK